MITKHNAQSIEMNQPNSKNVIPQTTAPKSRASATASQRSEKCGTAEFIDSLFQPTDWVLIRQVESWSDDKGKRRSRSAMTTCVTAGEARQPAFIQKLLKEASENRANIYFGACPRFGSSGYDFAWQIRTVRTLWCDIDHCSVKEALRRCHETGLPIPTFAVNSGNGAHVYWKLKDPYLIDDVADPPQVTSKFIVIEGKKVWIQSFRDPTTHRAVWLHDRATGKPIPGSKPELSPRASWLQDTLKAISQRLRGDNAHDPARLLRLPGTMNRKDERNGVTPKLCEVAVYEPTRVYEVHEFHRALVAVEEAKAPASTTASLQDGERTPKQSAPNERLPDDEVVRRAKAAENGPKFEMLWSGDHSEYQSQSEADLALCSIIAFWTGPNPEQIARIFRGSGLHRAKTEREDYLERTIARALAKRTEFYGQNPKSKQSVGSGRRIENSVVKEGKEPQPRAMADILEQIRAATDQGPGAVAGRLFVESKGDIQWLDKHAALFGHLGMATGVPAHFVDRAGFHTREEVFSELSRQVQNYSGIEVLPHEPPIAGIYYAGPEIPPGDGSALEKLIARFSPRTPGDRSLLKSLFATCIWGGPGGSRPAFVIAAPGGRGRGKTSVARAVSLLCRGHISLEKGDDPNRFKTRLLSPGGMTKRIVILDNLKSMKFSWPEVESMITATTISGHALYRGEMQRPNSLVWVITVNGANFSTDMAQRCVVIELADPKYDATWAAGTDRYIEQHRDAIIADAIAFLRAPPKPLGRYSRWSDWEDAVLSKLPQPAALQELIRSRQSGTDVEAEEAETFESHIARKLQQVHLNPEQSRVFIPSQVAADLYLEAMRDRQTTAQVSRWCNQKITEGRFQYLRPTNTKKYGRGYIWVGLQAEPSSPLVVNLEERLARLRRP